MSIFMNDPNSRVEQPRDFGEAVRGAALQPVKTAAIIHSDPQTIMTLTQREHLIVSQSIGRAVDFEGLITEFIQPAAPRRKPHSARFVLQHGHDVVTGQALLYPKRGEPRGTDAIKPVTSANPHVFLTILINRIDQVTKSSLV